VGEIGFMPLCTASVLPTGRLIEVTRASGKFLDVQGMFPDPSRPIPDRRSRLADNTFFVRDHLRA
jgi:hypothetical protein